jgi:hypothetical protein
MSAAADGLNDIYEALERYDWDDDIEFQAGLQAILGSNSTPEQATELALRARCFYYARYDYSSAVSRICWNGWLLTSPRKYSKNIDFDAYKAYRDARNRPPPTAPTSNNALRHSVVDEVLESSSNGPANSEAGGILPTLPATTGEPLPSYPTSFAHIVELITSGQPIPGIKEIPPTVLEGQGTQASKPRRKKPWEKDEIGTNT